MVVFKKGIAAAYGKAFEQGREGHDGFHHRSRLKEREAEIQSQPGHARIQCQCFAIERYGFLVMLLARLKESKVRISLSARWMPSQELVPL